MDKRLEMMKEQLMSCVQVEMNDLKSADAKELGEVIDMIKDLEEACYYATITEAMKGKDYYAEEYRDMDKDRGRMYYPYDYEDEKKKWRPPYTEREMPMGGHDPREGRSPSRRKMYMESKEMHHDKGKKLNELEEYMRDLGSDVTEMIQDASPEEKQMLHKKLTELATKIGAMNV